LRSIACWIANSCTPLLYDNTTRAKGSLPILIIAVGGFILLSAVVGSGKRKLLQAELAARRQPLTDPLTGLYNLRGLRVAARRAAAPIGVVLIDLDNFKGVNTCFGHGGADRLLQEVAKALAGAVGTAGVVARIGGDEFVALVPAAEGGRLGAIAQACREAVKAVADNLLGVGWPFGAGVGFATSSAAGRNLGALLAAADRRMYAEKERGRRGVLPALDGVRSLAPPSEEQEDQAKGVPADVRVAASWLGSAAAVVLTAFLGHGVQREGLLFLAAACAGLALLPLLASLTSHPSLGRLSGLAVAPALGAAIYLSGGSRSALLPLVLAAVTFSAQFARPSAVLGRLTLFVAAATTPFFYGPLRDRIGYLVPFIALTTTACVLTGILLDNRRRLSTARARALELARKDSLTGLPNRRAFNRALADAVAVFAAAGSRPVLCVVDLDNFKAVNDRHGHGVGDRLLKAVAENLSAVTRGCDCVARVGGDEFAVLAVGLERDTAEAIGQRLIQAVEEAAREVGVTDCGLAATVGIALCAQGGSPRFLLTAADHALLEAKEAGKRRVALASPQEPQQPPTPTPPPAVRPLPTLAPET